MNFQSGGGSYEDTVNSAPTASKGAGHTLEEVAKHAKDGRDLNVSNFLSQHPGGELDIFTFTGKDASAVSDLIQPSDVIGKYAPDAVIGTFGTGGGSCSAPASCYWRRGREVEGARSGQQEQNGARLSFPSLVLSVTW